MSILTKEQNEEKTIFILRLQRVINGSMQKYRITGEAGFTGFNPVCLYISLPYYIIRYDNEVMRL
jgi:hypothetical protein